MSPSESVLQRLRSLCLALPETSEADSWGHPNFRAGKRTFVTFEIVKKRPSIAFRLNSDDINRLLQSEQFFDTPYGRGQWVSMWADTKLDWKLITELLQKSYRVVAIKRMIKKLDTTSSSQAKY